MTPPPTDSVLNEPFAWMSKTKPRGPYKFTLRSPASEAVTGSLLVVTGVTFVAVLLADGSVPALALSILLLLVFVGTGVLLIVMAIARGRWIRAYRRLHGHVPPY